MKRSTRKGMLEDIAEAKRDANAEPEPAAEPAAEKPQTVTQIVMLPPAFTDINVQLHPISSFSFLARAEAAPRIGDTYRWTWAATLYYVRITSVVEKPDGKLLVSGGIYPAFHPAVADLQEALFLREAFNGSRLA